MIITRTPLRISLAGGSTDVPSFYRKSKLPGTVVSFAINKYVYVAVNEKFDGSFRISYSRTENVDSIEGIEHELVRESLRMNSVKTGLEITSISDLPGNGTGMGSSSAFTVGLLNALCPGQSPGALAERAFIVESEKCGHKCGKQDQYAAAHGGINAYHFFPKKVEVSPLELDDDYVDNLLEHSLLLWTRIARTNQETSILADQAKMYEDGTNIEYGKLITRQAEAFIHGLQCGYNFDVLGKMLDDAWQTKRLLVPGITNEYIDNLYEKAMDIGAYGGKLLGAGGGGFLFFLAKPELHAKIEEATCLKKVPFWIDSEGSKVVYEA